MASKRALIRAQAESSVALDRAIGCMVGMGVGDALGAPLEFLPASDEPSSRSHFDIKRMTFKGEKNKFRLDRGQWTDDAAMGLCMADSLLLKGGFDGSDMRVRFWCWWNLGYNNAFRKDPTRSNSVGLGGNISKSLEAISNTTSKSEVDPAFQAEG